MLEPLFEPRKIGAFDLPNAIVMAPMTRSRAGADDVPGDIMVEYYRQRASAGLIITEGVQPSAEGKGYWRTPGIWSAGQIDGWRRVSDAVHREGGRIVMQLMHCGRVCVRANKLDDSRTIAPSAIACADAVPGPDGVPVPTEIPEALTIAEIASVIAEFAAAAENARTAGFDGVELHCASGYLPNQFLNPNSNQRGDIYGGTPANRIRFALEVLEAMAAAIGRDRVGFRISPFNPYNDMVDDDPKSTFIPLLQKADKLGLAYVHLVDVAQTIGWVRENWSGNLIANNGLTPEAATKLLRDGMAEAVSFGRFFISNPDLVKRFARGGELAPIDRRRLYVGEERGYTDYADMTCDE